MSPSPQTSYSSSFSNPRPGTLVDQGLKEIVTGIATAQSPFGVLVVEDLSNPGQFAPLASAGDIAKNPSIVVATMAIESVRDALPAGYPALDAMNLLKLGRVWVLAEGDVVDGGAVYARHTANGGGKLQLGALRGDVDGGNAVILPGAKWRSTVSAGSVAIVEINQLGV